MEQQICYKMLHLRVLQLLYFVRDSDARVERSYHTRGHVASVEALRRLSSGASATQALCAHALRAMPKVPSDSASRTWAMLALLPPARIVRLVWCDLSTLAGYFMWISFVKRKRQAYVCCSFRFWPKIHADVPENSDIIFVKWKKSGTLKISHDVVFLLHRILLDLWYEMI